MKHSYVVIFASQLLKQLSAFKQLAGLFCFLGLLAPTESFAWSTLGHSVVNMTAAHMLAERKDFGFVRRHAFELSYYSNVPDLVWKRTDTYAAESTQHYMDLELFVSKDDSATTKESASSKDSATAKKSDAKSKEATQLSHLNIDDFKLDRVSYEKKYPDIAPMAGRSYWRIQELIEKLHEVEKQLQATDLESSARKQKQMQWLVLAGTIGHYIGDLGQPLHLTDNHDGQKSGQKGIHSYFEAQVVDELGPEIYGLVLKEARAREKTFAKKAATQSDLELIFDLGLRSYKDIPELLQIDKKNGRKSLAKSAELYRKMVIDRMADSALVLAELWSRAGKFQYDGEKFYEFTGEPPMIALPEGARIGLNDSQPKAAKPSGK